MLHSDLVLQYSNSMNEVYAIKEGISDLGASKIDINSIAVILYELSSFKHFQRIISRELSKQWPIFFTGSEGFIPIRFVL